MQKLTTAVIASAIILASAIPAFAQDSTSSTKTHREVVKEKVEARKEVVAQKIETRKENLASREANLKEKIASREAVLKEKLAKFKDKKKAQRVEAIDKTLVNINKNRTDQMTRFLDNASTILTKLETRVNQAGTNGKDITQANIAITEAKEMISSASGAVKVQSENGYTISVTTEAKVSTDAKIARDLLHTDLKAVLDQVKAAKKAVANAIQVSATTLGGTK